MKKNRTALSAAALAVATATLLAGCNDSEGQDPLEPRLSLEISTPASSGPIPPLPEGAAPTCGISIGGVLYSIPVYAQIKRAGGNTGDLVGTPIQATIIQRGGDATLSIPFDPENTPEDEGAGQEVVGCNSTLVSISQEAGANGTAVFYLTGWEPGRVELRVSTSVDGAGIEDSKRFTIDEPATATALRLMDDGGRAAFSGPYSVTAETEETIALRVLDANGTPVPDPADGAPNVRVSVADDLGLPPAGSLLDQDGTAVPALPLATRDGEARVAVRGDTPGMLILRVESTAGDGNPVPAGMDLHAIQVTGGIAGGAPLLITSREDVTLSAGEPALFNLQAQGGTAPYYWSLADGTLPEGLRLNTAGLIVGEPVDGQAGTESRVRVRVQDSSEARESDTLELRIQLLD
ncbi:MAG: hypothetical protein JJT90_09720 [Ectothiorhodospiraceae bacterium]|nr:hypothetical protein [Ectothiorhodospiraceae bacterium]